MKKLSFLVVVAIATVFTSCYQEPQPGTAKITVVDLNDFRVPSATVTLTQPGQLNTGYIVNEGLTNMNGEYSYTHIDQRVNMGVEVILNIKAVDGPKDGVGIIRIIPGQTTTETIKIQ